MRKQNYGEKKRNARTRGFFPNKKKIWKKNEYAWKIEAKA
jgi:hypothetical protein